MNLLYLTGIILSFFLFLLLLIKRGKTVAEKVLMVWMLVMGLHQLLFYLHYSGVTSQYPQLLGLDLAFPVLHSVLLYFYVAELTGQKRLRLPSAALHFIPFVLLVLLALPFYVLPGPEKITVIQNKGAGFEWYRMIQIPCILLSGLLYGAASLRLIKKSRAQMGDLFSNTDHKNLRWLEYLTWGLAVIWVLVLFFDDAVIFSGAAALVILIGIFGINQLPIFTAAPDMSLPPTQSFPAENNLARYAKSGLKPEEAELLYARLSGKIIGEALFKNNELTLTELATLLDVHPNYLSQVVNAREGKNFYNYVNTLRAREFIRLVALPEKRHFTLLALANECGFNSKSTFNKYVKLVCGKTPSELYEVVND